MLSEYNVVLINPPQRNWVISVVPLVKRLLQHLLVGS